VTADEMDSRNAKSAPQTGNAGADKVDAVVIEQVQRAVLADLRPVSALASSGMLTLILMFFFAAAVRSVINKQSICRRIRGSYDAGFRNPGLALGHNCGADQQRRGAHAMKPVHVSLRMHEIDSAQPRSETLKSPGRATTVVCLSIRSRQSKSYGPQKNSNKHPESGVGYPNVYPTNPDTRPAGKSSI